MFAIAVDNSEPIAKHSFYCYMSNYSWNNAVCTQTVNISITLSTGMLLLSPNEGSGSNRPRTIVSASSVGSLPNYIQVHYPVTMDGIDSTK